MKKKVEPSPGVDSTRIRAAVPLDDLLDDGEADPGAAVLVVGVEAAEHLEDPVEVLGLDPDPVVRHRELDHRPNAVGP